MSQAAHRMPLIDALKAIASQIILLHHLSSYGPIAATLRDVLPATMGWLFEYGRMAVQVFLVVGGFLAAQGLRSAPPPGIRALGAFVWKRWRRVGLPGFVAVLLVCLVTEAVRGWLDDPRMLSAPPTLDQLAAHALLVQ